MDEVSGAGSDYQLLRAAAMAHEKGGSSVARSMFLDAKPLSAVKQSHPDLNGWLFIREGLGVDLVSNAKLRLARVPTVSLMHEPKTPGASLQPLRKTKYEDLRTQGDNCG
jgi:hypothetical protein